MRTKRYGLDEVSSINFDVSSNVYTPADEKTIIFSEGVGVVLSEAQKLGNQSIEKVMRKTTNEQQKKHYRCL